MPLCIASAAISLACFLLAKNKSDKWEMYHAWVRTAVNAGRSTYHILLLLWYTHRPPEQVWNLASCQAIWMRNPMGWVFLVRSLGGVLRLLAHLSGVCVSPVNQRLSESLCAAYCELHRQKVWICRAFRESGIWHHFRPSQAKTMQDFGPSFPFRENVSVLHYACLRCLTVSLPILP